MRVKGMERVAEVKEGELGAERWGREKGGEMKGGVSGQSHFLKGGREGYRVNQQRGKTSSGKKERSSGEQWNLFVR